MSAAPDTNSQIPTREKTLKVRLVEGSYYVDHTGSDLEIGILQLFGTVLLRTPFTSGVDTSDLMWWLKENSKGYHFELVA